MTRAEKKEFETMVADALKKAMQQQSQKEWYSEDELLAKFGEASKSSLDRFRRSRQIKVARSPFCRAKFLYWREDVDALVAASIVPKQEHFVTVTNEQFK